MRRIIAAIVLAGGLFAGTVGFAEPAAAYNNAPASHICAYVVNSQPLAAPPSGPGTVTYCRDINWFGHYAVRIKGWYAGVQCGMEWVYDRHIGDLILITSWCT